MARKDYYDDPNGPASNSIVATASAIVTNEKDDLLVHPRTDNDVFAYSDGEVRQEFSVCVVCRIIGGTLRSVKNLRSCGSLTNAR